MFISCWRWALLLLFLTWFGVSAGHGALEPLELTVGGVSRTALIYVPAVAKEHPTPLVFVFHGHGGGPQNVARSLPMDRVWPEAISVYPAGLPTVIPMFDPEGKGTGWQPMVEPQGGRDLAFFDALLTHLRRTYRVDDHRIYSTGHSNGGGFTYLLWAERGDVLAATAPCAAAFFPGMATAFKPKPVFHIAGQKDQLVKFPWQQQTMEADRIVNACSATGTVWADGCVEYASTLQCPVVCFIHPGGHQVPPTAAVLIAKFFREHAKP